MSVIPRAGNLSCVPSVAFTWVEINNRAARNLDDFARRQYLSLTEAATRCFQYRQVRGTIVVLSYNRGLRSFAVIENAWLHVLTLCHQEGLRNCNVSMLPRAMMQSHHRVIFVLDESAILAYNGDSGAKDLMLRLMRDNPNSASVIQVSNITCAILGLASMNNTVGYVHVKKLADGTFMCTSKDTFCALVNTSAQKHFASICMFCFVQVCTGKRWRLCMTPEAQRNNQGCPQTQWRIMQRLWRSQMEIFGRDQLFFSMPGNEFLTRFCQIF